MLRFLDAGESHGKALIAILEGIPAGLKIDLDFINRQLLLRQSGYGRGGRQRIERDKVELLSGVRFSETIGSPIALMIENRDYENWKDVMNPVGERNEFRKVIRPRPGHADLTGYLKYNRNDIRDVLERSSARETAIRTAVGSVCELLLREVGVRLVSYVVSIGKVKADINLEDKELERNILNSPVFCPDKKATDLMIAEIEEAKRKGDSVGGVVEVLVRGVVAGVGSYSQWDRRLDARLAFGLMSVQAVKAVEIGDGFNNAYKFGSEVHDEIIYKDGYKRKSNRAGGIEGGMSNGENIVVRAYMKPIPTLRKGLGSVNVETHEAEVSAFERSDVCAVPALSVVARSVVAFELARAYLEKFGSDTVKEFVERVIRYKEYLSQK